MAAGIKGFSRICSDVGVEPKYSDGMFDVLCCDEYGEYFEFYYWRGQ